MLIESFVLSQINPDIRKNNPRWSGIILVGFETKFVSRQ